MRRPAAKIATLASTALVTSLLGVVALAAPAQAAPPIVAPDTFTVHAGTVTDLDVLANDSDPDGDPLAVCRVKEVLDGPVLFAQLDGVPVVLADPRTTGTFTFTYYACDFETLVPGTITVHVKPPVKMRLKVVKLDRRPGKVRVVNKGRFPVAFAWGHAEETDPDGEIRIGKKKSRVITVRRRAITWVALDPVHEVFRIGFLKGIRLPRGVKELPPSPNPNKVSRPGNGLRDLLQRGDWLPRGLPQR